MTQPLDVPTMVVTLDPAPKGRLPPLLPVPGEASLLDSANKHAPACSFELPFTSGSPRARLSAAMLTFGTSLQLP